MYSLILFPSFITGIILSSISYASAAEDKKPKANETEIICFAAQNQWVCAPEDQKEMAQKKALDMIDSNEINIDAGPLEINTMEAIPQFTKSVREEAIVNKNTDTIADTSETAPAVIPTQNTNPLLFEYWQSEFPGHWSYQLIGLSNKHNLSKFVKQHQLKEGEYVIVQTTVKDAPWWIVLHGLYANKELGKANVNQLPKALIGKAWLRKVNTISGKSDHF